MVTDFTLIRHGETEANHQRVLQGQMPTDLDDLGRIQAQCVADRLKNEHFDRIISSDLARAWKTAEIIGEKVHAPLFAEPRLREWNLGDFQGQPVSEINKICPQIMDAFRLDCGDIAIPGGEKLSELNSRVAACVDELAEKYAGQKILLVSHGGAMRAIFRRIAGPSVPGAMLPMVSNASYSRFLNRDGLWQLCCWNDVSHLNHTRVRESAIF